MGWSGAGYDAVAAPQAAWGAAVLDRLPLRGDERVLDAGCGSGRVTEQLLQRLPQGGVVALDASASMLEQARLRLHPYADRVEFVLADLTRPLPLSAPVDAVLSTAVFHWIDDHDALFANLAAVTRSGGRLEAQCGARGQLARLECAARDLGVQWRDSAGFPAAEETAACMQRSGWVDVRCWVHEEPTGFDSDASFERFLREVCLHPQLAHMDAEHGAAFVHAVAQRLGDRVLDYVRLNMSAARG